MTSDPNLTLEVWKNRVLGSVRVRTPEEAATIATACLETYRKEGSASTWHEAAKLWGTECHCFACHKPPMAIGLPPR